jgi:hypothetical protein
MVLLVLPKLTGHHRALHATNAMIAVFTQAAGPLIRTCIRAVDCTYVEELTKWELDAMPEIVSPPTQ